MTLNGDDTRPPIPVDKENKLTCKILLKKASFRDENLGISVRENQSVTLQPMLSQFPLYHHRPKGKISPTCFIFDKQLCLFYYLRRNIVGDSFKDEKKA